jgi:hypothetical protein
MSFRVSFYWAEADARGLPAVLTEQVKGHYACMAGTNCASPRCAALAQAADGTVACSVYAQRPSPCREVEIGDAKCTRARAKHGLAPLDRQRSSDTGARNPPGSLAPMQD